MDHAVERLIEHCRRELLGDPNHLLSFSSRRSLLKALGPLVLDARGYGRELSAGKRRRTELAWRAAMRSVSAWEQGYGTLHAHSILDSVRAYLDGRATLESLEAQADAFQGALLHDQRGNAAAYLAGRAAAAAAWVAVGDEMLVPDAGVTQAGLDHPEDPDLWDAAFFAAGSTAGGIPGAPAFDRDAYREFWLWYLDQAVPAACELGGQA